MRIVATHRVSAAMPWLAFLGIMLLGWHRTNLLHMVPSAYGDVLEGTWATMWLGDSLLHGTNPSLYPLAFHPVGWPVITYAWGPANFLLLIPLYWLGGAAFAYNVATIAGFLVAFSGTYLLARRFLPRFPATVSALLFTVWGFRWYTVGGQLNVGLGSALLPWFIWCLEVGSQSKRKPWMWYGLAGVTWALAANSSLYFIWIDAVAFGAWFLARCLLGKGALRAGLYRSLLAPVVAGLLSLPMVYLFWQASNTVGAPFFTVYDINLLGASLNILPVPYILHPWLGTLTQAVYKGPFPTEVSSLGVGTLSCLMALFAVRGAWRSQTWRPLLVLAAVGLVLSLGLTVRWNDQTVQWPWMGPFNAFVWQIAHRLRPDFFVGVKPPAPFTDAVYLPGLVLTALLPGLERARVYARYAFLFGLGVFMLAGLGISRIQAKWLRLSLAALVILEVIPPPTQPWPYPPPPHPAFAWLREQTIKPEGIIDFRTIAGSRLEFIQGGELIYSTVYHNQPTVNGPSSIWPAHTSFFREWLVTHGHPFQDPEFMILLNYFKARYLVLHMNGDWDAAALEEAKQSGEFQFEQCFPPSTGVQWGYPICVLRIQPKDPTPFNVLFREGWSGPEQWGRWIDGLSAKSVWINTGTSQQVEIQAFPNCVPDKRQNASIEVNGVQVADHQWQDCQPWDARLTIPSGLLHIGPNDLTIRASYAVSPTQSATGGDTRQLSLGVTRLRLVPGP
jgi:hypothetical protein